MGKVQLGQKWLEELVHMDLNLVISTITGPKAMNNPIRYHLSFLAYIDL